MHLSAAPERCFVLEAKLGLIDVCIKTCKQAGKPDLNSFTEELIT